jgi:hypothetical protein
MDFYQIGAMKLFSQLGQLIEADDILAAEAARQQKQEDALDIKISDLPSEVMQQIGGYLLQDPNKKIHKIFKNRPDDNLQVLLFGEVKDLTYINIYSSDNEIDYPMNYKLLDYVNYILKVKGVKNTLEKMRVNFYVHTYKNPNIKDAKLIIKFINKKGKEIAAIEQEYHIGRGIMGTGGGYNYVLSYRHENKWNKQKIQKNDVIKEYNVIHDEITNKYF